MRLCPKGIGILFLMLALTNASCGKSGVVGEIATFKDTGHAVSAFSDTDASALGAKKCQSGTIDQIAVLFCEYAESDEAKRSQPAAVRWAGESGTSIVLHREKVLMALADRNSIDPTGKALSSLVKVFRRGKGR